MASWSTPKTNWVNTDFWNYDDMDRVEENTEYVNDEFVLIGYNPSTTTFTYPRTTSSFDFYDDLNRIENNILAIKNATWEPLVWTTPQTDWASVQQSFSYVDANRLEKNLLYLYNMLNNIKDAFLQCGSPNLVCGKGNTLF